MASTRFQTLILAGAVLAAAAAPVGAAPIISFSDFYTDRYAANPLSSLPDGDFVQINAGIASASTPDPVSSLSVAATQGSLTVPLNYFPFTGSIFDPLFSQWISFAQAETGIGWTITATDSTGTSAPVFTPAIAAPVLLPYATDVTVSDTSTTPTVSWTLPDLTGFSVDLVRFRIIDASSEALLTNETLSPAATSFMVPDGILAPGESYIYRVILVDQANTIENSSNAFSSVTTTVPEPGTLTLLLAALTGFGAARRGRSIWAGATGACARQA